MYMCGQIVKLVTPPRISRFPPNPIWENFHRHNASTRGNYISCERSDIFYLLFLGYFFVAYFIDISVLFAKSSFKAFKQILIRIRNILDATENLDGRCIQGRGSVIPHSAASEATCKNVTCRLSNLYCSY